MSSTLIVKVIVRMYFIGALIVSATHIIGASHKLDLFGWQALTSPFAVDGIAVIGLMMRGEKWSTDTRRLGLRVQMTAGLISLAANVFAGNTIGERIYGVIIVVLFIFSEWLSDRMVTAAQEVASVELVKAEAARVAKREADRRRRAELRIARELANKDESRRVRRAAKVIGV